MNSLLDYQAAAVGFAVAFLLAVLLTPVVSLVAWRAGLLDHPEDDRRMHRLPVPRLGGLAIFAAIAIPSLALGNHHGFWGVMLGAALMTVLGAVDDVVPLHPGVKFTGQIGIAALPVALSSGNISIDHITLPLIGAFDLGPAAYPVTIIMGVSGSLMLGYLLATLAIEGVLKTAAAVSLVFPLVVLALPILDTSFVILKRLKYRQPIYQADRWHFHHRFANIGFSQRRTALTLYAWCFGLSAFALAIRFVPAHRHGWSWASITILAGMGLIALASSAYVIYTLEIIKLRRLRGLRGGRAEAEEPSVDR